MPYNFVTVEAGNLLHEINSVEDIMNRRTVVKLLAIAFFALLPLLVKRFTRGRPSVDLDELEEPERHG